MSKANYLLLGFLFDITHAKLTKLIFEALYIFLSSLGYPYIFNICGTSFFFSTN